MPKLKDLPAQLISSNTICVDYMCLGVSSFSNNFTEAKTFGTVELPNCTTLNYFAFANWTVSSLSLPNVTSIPDGTYAFICTSIDTIKLPKLTTLRYNVFTPYNGAIGASMKYLVFNNLTYIYTSGYNSYSIPFRDCYRLEKLVLDCSDKVTVGPSITYLMFSSTPMNTSSYLGYYGSIYVHDVDYSWYLTARNWSAFSSRITTIEEHETELRQLGLID